MVWIALDPSDGRERAMKTSIMVVDDEIAFPQSVERMLRLEGYEEVTTVWIPPTGESEP